MLENFDLRARGCELHLETTLRFRLLETSRIIPGSRACFRPQMSGCGDRSVSVASVGMVQAVPDFVGREGQISSIQTSVIDVY